MNGVIKFVIGILMVAYLISPIDACPGPIDDILVMLLGYSAQRRLAN